MRAKQTLKGLVEALGSNHIVGAREEPRITGAAESSDVVILSLMLFTFQYVSPSILMD